MNNMTTSQRIYHIFACTGTPTHVHTGTALLKSGDAKTCPVPGCNKPVADITNTPLGQSYFAFARPDMGAR